MTRKNKNVFLRSIIIAAITNAPTIIVDALLSFFSCNKLSTLFFASLKRWIDNFFAATNVSIASDFISVFSEFADSALISLAICFGSPRDFTIWDSVLFFFLPILKCSS